MSAMGRRFAPTWSLAEDAERLDRRGDVTRRRAARLERRAGAACRATSSPTATEGEERVVRQREEGPAQRREDGELVVGPLDGRERVPHGADLLALVERAAADEDVGDAPRLERAHVGAGEVVAEALEALEEEAHVARVDGHGLVGPLALGDPPAALVDEPVDERAHRVGQRLARSRSR